MQSACQTPARPWRAFRPYFRTNGPRAAQGAAHFGVRTVPTGYHASADTSSEGGPTMATKTRKAPVDPERLKDHPSRTADPAWGRVPEEYVRVRAYHLWAEAGRPECDGVEFWLRAERELKGGK